MKKIMLVIFLSMLVFSEKSTISFYEYNLKECPMSSVPVRFHLLENMNNEKVEEIKEIRPINCSEKQLIGWNYYRDSGGVYLNGTSSSLYAGWVWLELLNPDTTVYLGRDYIKDDKYVYNYARIIERADPNTFVILDDSFYYSKDKTRVFFRGMEIEGLNPATLKILKGSYAKDNHNVYYEKIKLGKADAKTFKVLKEDVYAKDLKNIYYRENLMEKADYKTFEVINFIYSKDKNHVFSYGKKITGADPNTFKLYSGSDPEFEKIGEHYDSMDKNNYYSHGKIVKKKYKVKELDLN